MNLLTALGLHSIFASLESLLNLEQNYETVTAISVEVYPGISQIEQNYIRKWRSDRSGNEYQAKRSTS